MLMPPPLVAQLRPVLVRMSWRDFFAGYMGIGSGFKPKSISTHPYRHPDHGLSGCSGG